jgi:hypothetical protein
MAPDFVAPAVSRMDLTNEQEIMIVLERIEMTGTPNRRPVLVYSGGAGTPHGAAH